MKRGDADLWKTQGVWLEERPCGFQYVPHLSNGDLMVIYVDLMGFMVIYRDITLNLGKFHYDLTATEPWNHGLFEGNHPQRAEPFRLVKYDNLPRSFT